MEHKKDIGNHIETIIKSAEKTPSASLWDKIDTTLEKKKKKKRKLFIWYFLGGSLSAALLILVLINLNESSIDSQKINTQIVPEVVTETSPIKTIKNSQTISGTNNETNIKNAQKIKANSEDFKSETTLQNNKITSKTNNTTKDNKQQKNTTRKTKINKREIVYSSKSNKDTKGVVITNSKKTQEKERTSIQVIEESVSLKEQSVSKTSKNKILFLKIKTDSVKDSVKEKNAVTETKSTKEDSLKAALIKKKRERYAQKRAKKLEKNNTSLTDSANRTKWSVTLLGGPVLFEASRNGSLIDKDLVGNNKTARINFAYGVAANFKLSEQLTVSFGGIKNKLNYTTEDVPTATTVDINSIFSYTNLNYDASVSEAEVRNFLNNKNTAAILHQLEYVEIPLQFTYRMKDSNFGFQVYGGISTYLLTDNFIALVNEDSDKLTIGSTFNLSKVNFSLNAGAGVYYDINDRFTLDLNPTLKYQFNTLDNINFDGKTYLLGVYTGFTYRLNIE